MSFDFGSLEKKSNTAKTSKPSAGTQKSVSSGKPDVSTQSFDFSNLSEEKSTPSAIPQTKEQPKTVSIPSGSHPKPVVKPIAIPTVSAETKPTPKPVTKPAPKPVVKSDTAKKTTSTSVSSFDFGGVSSSSPKASTKTSGKPATKSVHGSHSTKDHRKGKRSSSPLDALKDLNPMALSAGIGGVVLLIVVIVCLFMGGEEKKPAPTSNDKWKAYCKAAYEFTNKGEYQKAIAEYEKAYKLNPKDNYAPDQISIIYRQNLHDEAQANHWKSISDSNQAGNLENMEGLSARAYAERAEKKKARQGKR